MFGSQLLAETIGYVRLFAFPSDGSCDSLNSFASQLDGALSSLRREGAQAWILDLRSNPGGGIIPASFMAARFGFEGLVATAHYPNGAIEPFESIGMNAIGRDPVVVLVDQYSASASEVVAFDLQESRRARVLGARTQGSVVVGVGVPVFGGTLQVTAALLEVGPENKRLDFVGVQPDKIVSLDLNLLAREQRDSQLEAAIAELQSKLSR
jgi:carboxyl-terminal processing protease